MKIRAVLIAVCLTIALSSTQGNAKTYAYLASTDGKVTKIDADTSTIVSTKELPQSGGYVQSGETSVVADRANNRLYVVVGRLGSKVLVYDLKTLQLVKDLGIRTPEPDITIFASPDGKKVFIIWLNTDLEGGAWQFDVYDGSTLTRTTTLDYYFFPKQPTFSSDSGTLYAIEGGDWARVKTIDLTSFKITSTIDLKTIWRTDVFAQAVVDYLNENILIGENDKQRDDEVSRYTLFVHNLKTRRSSARIATGLTGKVRLVQGAARILFDETQIVLGRDDDYIEYEKSLGRLHVYDVASGRKLGTVRYTVDSDRGCNIVGIHPSGTKAYLMGKVKGVKSLIVLDIVNFKALKTIPIPDSTLSMVFYEE